ncbi:hypothetical protein HUJ05_005104, partial [Dendroctonus ponderosae]
AKVSCCSKSTSGEDSKKIPAASKRSCCKIEICCFEGNCCINKPGPCACKDCNCPKDPCGETCKCSAEGKPCCCKIKICCSPGSCCSKPVPCSCTESSGSPSGCCIIKICCSKSQSGPCKYCEISKDSCGENSDCTTGCCIVKICCSPGKVGKACCCRIKICCSAGPGNHDKDSAAEAAAAPSSCCTKK